MTSFFLGIYDFLKSRPLFRWLSLVVIVILLAIASLRMEVKEDISDFLPSDGDNDRVSWAFTHMGGANRVVLTISAQEADSLERKYILMDAVDSLEKSILENVPSEYVASVTARVDNERISDVTSFITGNLPYYLTDEDYRRLDSLLESGSFLPQLELDREIVTSPAGVIMQPVVVSDPLLLSSRRLQSLDAFKSNSSFKMDEDYIFSSDGSSALIMMDLPFSGSDTWRGKRFIGSLNNAIARCEASFGGEITVDALGSIFIAQTNADRIKKDSLLSISIAVVLIALLLIVFFRKGRSILMVGVTLLFGFLFSFGLCALINGSISLVVIGMGSVIIGIAANYPLHFLAHIRQGYSPRQSLCDIVQPLTTGNITTVGAFLSLLFLSSPAMRDLGLFAALLLAATILFTLIYLPHMVGEGDCSGKGLPSWGGLSNVRMEKQWWVVASVAVITVLLSFFDDKVGFDSNMSTLNYMTQRQKANMDKMLSYVQGNRCLTYVAVEGSSLDEAIDRYDSYRETFDSLARVLPEGTSVTGVGDLVPGGAIQRDRTDRWNEYMDANGERIKTLLRRDASSAGFKDGVFSSFEELIDRRFDVVPPDSFSPLASSLASGCFICDSSRFAVLTTFGSDISCTETISRELGRRQDIAVFDSSSMTDSMVSSLSEDFDTVLYFCAFIVFALLLVSFGSPELSVIAFLPLSISWIWILGIMGIFGIHFNIVNIILATFIFGMGDDYTIFIVEGLVYEYAYGKKMLHTYKSTIILSSLIMFAGIGSLIVARHPAMLSLAYVVMIGMVSVVLMAYLVPPVIFRWLTVKKGKVRREPLTLVNLLSTVLAFIVFLAGSLIITIAGFFLITLTFGSKRGKYLYHCLLNRVSGFMFRNVFFTRHTIDLNGETFDKPSIIISNHQSHLDLMALLMLSPKIVVVTNRWVWNNPFYGILIRYAGFCPVDNLLSDDLSAIEKKIAEGYSVLVFPEGTRTLDGTIGRFHRGAFYLARKYGLDIVPVLLHGLHEVLPKDDLLLRKGVMSVRVLPRVKADDTSFGEDYRDMASNIRKMYVEKLSGLSSEMENCQFYADRVRHNYLYKGTQVFGTVRRNMRENACYATLCDALPLSGRVLFIEPSYGEPSLVCSLVRKDLIIEAVISDEMTRALAARCQAVPANLKYISAEERSGEYDLIVRFSGGRYRLEHKLPCSAED